MNLTAPKSASEKCQKMESAHEKTASSLRPSPAAANNSVEQEITERTEGWGWGQVEVLMVRGDSLNGEPVRTASAGHQSQKTLCFLRFLMFAAASLRCRGERERISQTRSKEKSGKRFWARGNTRLCGLFRALGLVRTERTTLIARQHCE